MIKKAKIFGIFFPTAILLPFSAVITSCGKQKNDSATSSNTSENDNKINISEEIKTFIKTNVSPNKDNNESIVVIKDLVNSTDSKTKRLESEKIESSLGELASKLSKTNDDDEIELRDNKIVEDALKQIIYEKCKSTSSLLKTQFSGDFGEVATEKILEVEENGLFFNLKTFDIDKILHGIGYSSDTDTKIEIANSQALKIYRFSTNLKVITNTNGGKKAQLTINDLNLFVVSDKEQTVILQNGISNYLQEKFKNNIIKLYLDGNELKVKSDKEINEHFTEILEKRNYNLVDNENIKKQTMSYLADKYLPKLIYKNSKQGIENGKQEMPIEIESSNPTFNQEKDNFLKEGMDIPESLKTKINFLNFFGNQQKSRQISVDDIKEIKPDHFLKDKKIYNEQYYSLGAGTFSINEWNIRKFRLHSIDIKFEIFINREIFEKEIRNLHICLNNLLDTMNKSSVNPNFIDKKFVFDIVWNKSISATIASQLKNEKNAQGTESKKLGKYLTLAYINPAKETSENNNFSGGMSKNIAFNFEINISEEKDPSNPSNKFNEKLEVYFVFNSSFRIKLSNELMYHILDNEVETGKAKLAQKNLSDLKQPVSTVVSADNNADEFKEALITTLQVGNFATLTDNDVEIKKTDGTDLDDTYIGTNPSVTVKVIAKTESENFKGTTGILTIKRSAVNSPKNLADLEEPVSLVVSVDSDANAFKTALINDLKVGNFATLTDSDVEIKKTNGTNLDNAYIGTNPSVTVKIVAKSSSSKFIGTKTLTVKRPGKLQTRFHII